MNRLGKMDLRWLRRFGSLTVLVLVAHMAHQAGASSSAHASLHRGLPNANIARSLTMGHQTSLADLYWLKLVQYIGTPGEDLRNWPELEPLAKFVTTVDPLYGYAYQASGVLLSTAGRVQAANEILEKGFENVPDRWELPFFLGFNHWNELGDLKRGGDFLFQASRLAGSPRYLGELATRLYSSSGSIEDGLELLSATLQVTTDSLMRQELEQRQGQLLSEQALQRIEAEISAFIDAEGRIPSSLSDLASPLLHDILASEFGATIEYDPLTGQVASSLLPKRLVVYRAAKVPKALAAP